MSFATTIEQHASEAMMHDPAETIPGDFASGSRVKRRATDGERTRSRTHPFEDQGFSSRAENLPGENGSNSGLLTPRISSDASAPTAELVVTPWPPRPATQKNPSTCGSQPMMKRPSLVSVLNPAQLLLIETLARAGM